MPVVANGNFFVASGTVDTTGDPIDLRSAGAPTDLVVGSGPNSTVVLEGSGGVLMSDAGTRSTNRIYANNSNVALDNRTTISGAGEIFGHAGLSLVNSATGVIDATGTHALEVHDLNMTNSGLMRASGSGGLLLTTMGLDQSGGGTLRADGGDVVLNSRVGIVGGNLSTTGTSVIRTAVASFENILDGSRAGAPLTITEASTVQVTDGTTLTVKGTITDNGTLRLNSGGSRTDLIVGQVNGDTVVLQGSGAVVLSDAGTRETNRIYSNNSNVTLDNRMTISGAGEIFGHVGLSLVNSATGVIDATGTRALEVHDIAATNDGLMQATGSGGLRLTTMTLDQTGGGTVRANGGDVVLSQSGIIGGTLATAAGGVIRTADSSGASALDGSHAGAPVTIADGSTVQIGVASSLVLRGTIDNHGTLQLAASGGFSDLIIADTSGASVLLTGGGIIALNNATTDRIYSTASGTTLRNVDNTIAGAGQIQMQAGLSLINEAAGSIVASIAGQALTLELPATNHGRLVASTGATLNVNGLTNLSGGSLTDGRYVVEAGGTMLLNTAGGSAVSTLAADLSLASGSSLRAGNAATPIEQSLAAVAAGGHLSLAAFNGIWSNAIVNSGTISLADDVFTAAAGLTMTVGGSTRGFGTLDTAIANDGLILASGGTLRFEQSVSGSGLVMIADAAAAHYASTATVAVSSFDGVVNASIDTLIVDNAAGFTSTIRNFQADDRIIIGGAASASIAGYDPQSDTSLLTVRDNTGATIATLTLAGNFTGQGFAIDGTGAIKLLDNQQPIVSPIAGSAGEDGPTFMQDLLQGAFDPDGDALSVTGPDAAIVTAGGRALTLGTHYIVEGGLFSLTASGFAVFNSLGATQTDTFILHFGVSDGVTATMPSSLTITVTGANDAASAIGGTATAAVSEDGLATVSGLLTFTDADASEGRFQVPANLAGTYGTFAFDSLTGAWSYTLADTQANVQALGDGEVVHDTLTVSSFDGTTSRTIDVTITGANDAPLVSGPVVLGASNEDEARLITTAELLANSRDVEGQALRIEGLTVSSGAVRDNGDGTWTFTPVANDETSVMFSYLVTDGLAAPVAASATLDLLPVADAAVIGGVRVGSVTEDALLAASGVLTVTDPDTGEASFAARTVAGSYGTLSLAASGSWTYALNNAGAAVQGLVGGQSVTDAFTVQSLDGTTVVIGITVNGADEGTGVNIVTGTARGEILRGSSLSDVITALGGADTVLAGAGNDTIKATINDGKDLYDGGDGVDTVDYSALTQRVDVVLSSLLGGTGVASGRQSGIDGLKSIENVVGSQGGDTICGNRFDNRIDGWGGNDRLTGGHGNDTFAFHDAFGYDTITDFDCAGNDVIELSRSQFADFAAVRAHMTADRGNVVIETPDHLNRITLLNTTLASMTADDFVFI